MRGGDLERGLDPHVGLDQQLLEALEHGVVEHAALVLAEEPADEPGRAAAGSAAGALGAAGSAGASSMMASSPSSSFEEDLKSRSLSFWKNAIPAPASPSRRLP